MQLQKTITAEEKSDLYEKIVSCIIVLSMLLTMPNIVFATESPESNIVFYGNDVIYSEVAETYRVCIVITNDGEQVEFTYTDVGDTEETVYHEFTNWQTEFGNCNSENYNRQSFWDNLKNVVYNKLENMPDKQVISMQEELPTRALATVPTLVELNFLIQCQNYFGEKEHLGTFLSSQQFPGTFFYVYENLLYEISNTWGIAEIAIACSYASALTGFLGMVATSTAIAALALALSQADRVAAGTRIVKYNCGATWIRYSTFAERHRNGPAES